MAGKIRIPKRMFRTSDGYIFYWFGGKKWCDHVVADLTDMEFKGNSMGPRDDDGRHLPGQLAIMPQDWAMKRLARNMAEVE